MQKKINWWVSIKTNQQFSNNNMKYIYDIYESKINRAKERNV